MFSYSVDKYALMDVPNEHVAASELVCASVLRQVGMGECRPKEINVKNFEWTKMI